MIEDARKGNAIGARSKQRQLAAWLQRRHLELAKHEKKGQHRHRSEEWLITADDIAAEFETACHALPDQAKRSPCCRAGARVRS